jgi:hypothetical protein
VKPLGILAAQEQFLKAINLAMSGGVPETPVSCAARLQCGQRATAGYPARPHGCSRECGALSHGQFILTASIDNAARVFRVVTLSEIAELLAK